LWRHVTDRAEQSRRVVAIHVALNQAARIFHRQRRERPNAFAFKICASVPIFRSTVDETETFARGSYRRSE
jgi:hypothetical protein